MKQSYYYLISSLPALEFGAKPFLSYRDFLRLCQEQMPFSDAETIRRASIDPCEDYKDSSGALRNWRKFDITLRNEIARARALKQKKDPAKYSRCEECHDVSLVNFAQWLVEQESPREAELSLDRFRWERIEEFSKGHYFDIDYLVFYALKLKIIERWYNVDSEGGMELLDKLLKQETTS